jgi:hypothetical protein
MPLERLTAAQLSANQEYVNVLKSLKVGEGVKATVQGERVGKITIKKHLEGAAEAAGVQLKYVRTGPQEVVAEIVNRSF